MEGLGSRLDALSLAQIGCGRQRRKLQRRVLAESVRELASSSAFPLEATVTRCRTGGSLLGVSDDDGHVSLHSLTTRGPAVRRWRAHSNAVFDLGWLEPTKLLSASADRQTFLWDLHGHLDKPAAVFQGHTHSIRTLAACGESRHVFATGDRDGDILVWDTRNRGRKTRAALGAQTYVSKVEKAHEWSVPEPLVDPLQSRRPSVVSFADQQAWHSAARSPRSPASRARPPPVKVTAVLFPSEHSLLSASDNVASAVRLWDLRFLRQRHPQPVQTFHVAAGRKKRGFTSLCLDRTQSRLFAVSTASVVFEFSLAHLSHFPQRELHGLRVEEFYLDTAASPDADLLLGGSCDGSPCVWDIGARADERPPLQPLARLAHGQSNVTAVAWAPSGVLVTCSETDFRLWAPPHVPLPKGEALVEAKAVAYEPPTKAEAKPEAQPSPRTRQRQAKAVPVTPTPSQRARRRLSLAYHNISPLSTYDLRKRQRPGSVPLSPLATPEKENRPPRPSRPNHRAFPTPTARLPNLVLAPLSHPQGTPPSAKPPSSRKARSARKASSAFTSPAGQRIGELLTTLQMAGSGRVVASPTKGALLRQRSPAKLVPISLPPEAKRPRRSGTLRDYFSPSTPSESSSKKSNS